MRRTTGLSKVQGSTTGTLAAATDAQERTGLGRVQGSTTGSLAAASAAQGRTTGLGGVRGSTTDTQPFLALLLTLQKHREEGLGRVRGSTAGNLAAASEARGGLLA